MKTFLGLFIVFCVFKLVSAVCNPTCANDEICNASGNTCSCNSTAYPSSGGLPAPTINCNGGNLNIYVSKCWLEANGYNTSFITLQNTSCLATREIMNNTAQMVFHNSLANNVCNNSVTQNATYISYANKMYIYGVLYPVQIRKEIIMNVSCIFSFNTNIQLNVTLKPILGSSSISVPGINANLAVNMGVYKDSSFTTLLADTDLLYVDDTIYVSVVIPNLDASIFKIKVMSMYAFPGGAVTPVYDLLTNGCPASGVLANQMTVIANGVGNEARFAMQVFLLTGFNSVMLSANVSLCSSNCALGCNAQSRSADIQGTPVTVTVSLDSTTPYDVSSASGFSVAWTLSTLTLSWISVMLM